MKQIICLNQLIRPTNFIKIQNVGDCTICKSDKKNKNCKNYTPITIFIMDIEENSSDKNCNNCEK